MGVISVRLNNNEEKMLKHLSEYFGADKSDLVRKSLADLYESILDLKAIERFEKREKRGRSVFSTAEDILSN